VPIANLRGGVSAIEWLSEETLETAIGSAVWAANSVFKQVSEGEVCGVYDYTLLWRLLISS
jgi:hypothetical protein